MANDNPDELRSELEAHLKAARDLSDRVDSEGRDYTDTERSQVNELIGKATDVKNRLKRANGDAAVKNAISDLGGVGVNEKSERRSPAGLIVPGRGESVGSAYVKSNEFQELIGSAPGGTFQKNHRVNSRPTGFESLLPQRKGLVTGASDTSAGAFLRGDDLGLKVGLEPFERPLKLRDLVTSGTTTSDSIEYARVTSITNNAAPVNEATSSAPDAAAGDNGVGGAGGWKPESSIATARVQTPVRTIAHWIPITKRALSDAAQMVTLIDSFLEYGLEEEVEDQMIAGDGTGENLEGLANVSGVQLQDYDTNLLVTTRKARTLIKLNGRAQPNGYVINPADLEEIELLREDSGAGPGTGQFFFGGPAASGGAPTLWGLPVVESEAVPAGTAYVGDWRKSVLWDRQQSAITTTDSHESFFIRNLVAVLAELRVAFGVLQPSAFARITLNGGSTGGSTPTE